MKKLPALLLSILTSGLCAQQIEGRLADSEGGPLALAAVTLLQQADSSLVKATVSRDDGSFLLPGIPVGSYLLRSRILGFAPLEVPLDTDGRDLNLGTLVLEEQAQGLDQVTVTAEKPLVQVMADKTVFNVAGTLNAVGSSALELLRKAPGVVIANDGGVILEGKSGVQYYVNGKPSPLSGTDLTAYLESLQASDIESLELITQPSARYDAAGNAGIINIVLKKDKSLGTNGSVSTGVSVGHYKNYNGSVTFNSRGKSGNLYGSYSNRFGKSYNFLNLLRLQDGIRYDARTRSSFDQNANNMKLGYDYQAADRHSLGLLFTGSFNNTFGNNDSRTPIYPDGAMAFDSVLVAESRTANRSQNLNANLNYRYADTLGNSFSADLDYGRYNSDRNALQPNVYLDGSETSVLSERTTFQITPIDIDIYSGRMDLELPLGKGTLGTGLKAARVKTGNQFDFYNQTGGTLELDPGQSNRFAYTEEVYAAYLSVGRKWESWSLQAGLRLEQTRSDGLLTALADHPLEQVKRRYTNAFPSGGITWQASAKQQWALTYSRRIQRPSYSSLNPFRYQIDELSYRQGNPFLQPQYADNLKLSHTYNYRLTTSVSYGYTSDFFAQVTVADGASRNFITTRNVADVETWNLGVSWPQRVLPWWNMYLSLNAYNSSYRANSPEFQPVSRATLSGYLQHTLELPGQLRMEISGWFSTPSVWGGTYLAQSLGSLNLAFQRKFAGDRLTARLALNDLLYTVPWRGTTRFGTLSIDGSGGSDSRQAAFSLTYDFGRNEIKKARKRETGTEEERKRIGD